MAPRLVSLAVGVCILATGFSAGYYWPHTHQSAATTVTLSAADIGFAQEMSTHHEQAVLLAQSLAPDVDPQVRVIADQITVSQTAEVATMHGWLTLFGQPFTPPSPMSGMAMRSSPMPGMASISEITRLSQLHGRDSEILFLQLMIRHHRGGIDMAQAAYDGPLQEPIRRMALDMIQQQGNEIGEMTALLATRSAQPLAYP